MAARAKIGKSEAAISADVANGAVDHVTGGAPVLRDGLHDLADQRPRLVAAAVDDDHVARADQFERLMDGEIVARPRPHGEGDPDQAAAAMKRPQAHRARQALQGCR